MSIDRTKDHFWPVVKCSDGSGGLGILGERRRHQRADEALPHEACAVAALFFLFAGRRLSARITLQIVDRAPR